MTKLFSNLDNQCSQINLEEENNEEELSENKLNENSGSNGRTFLR